MANHKDVQVTIKQECDAWCYDESDLLQDDLSGNVTDKNPDGTGEFNEIISYACDVIVKTEPNDLFTINGNIRESAECAPHMHDTVHDTHVTHIPKDNVKASGYCNIVSTERNDSPTMHPENVYIKEERIDEPKATDHYNGDSVEQEPNKENCSSYTCRRCDLRFRSRMLLRNHLRTHNRDPVAATKRHTCTICGKSFRWQSGLSRHKRIHKCDMCRKNSTNTSVPCPHQPLYKKKKIYMCSACGKGCGQLGELRQHERIHTGERPYECNVCSKTFSFKSSFYRHRYTHNDQWLFTCELCGRGFKHPEPYRKHVRNVLCDRKRRRRGAYSGGSRSTYDPTKEYVCNWCNKTLTSRTSLQRHIYYTHANERPYGCDKCGNAFRHPDTLRKHKNTHVWHYYD